MEQLIKRIARAVPGKDEIGFRFNGTTLYLTNLECKQHLDDWVFVKIGEKGSVYTNFFNKESVKISYNGKSIIRSVRKIRKPINNAIKNAPPENKLEYDNIGLSNNSLIELGIDFDQEYAINNPIVVLSKLEKEIDTDRENNEEARAETLTPWYATPKFFAWTTAIGILIALIALLVDIMK